MIATTKTRLDRLEVLAKTKKLDGFLFTSPSSIKCFSGYYYNFETGMSPFHVLPAALFVFPFELKTLLVADNEQDKLSGLHPDVHVLYYSSYTYEKPLHFTEDFFRQVVKIIKANKLSNASIAIEQNSLPWGFYKALHEHSPEIKLTDVTSDLTYLKAIKDEDEIGNIRKASQLADIGQAAILKYAREGITELELFSKARLVMETEAGTRVPMMTDLVSGKYTASGGGNPTNKIINENDLILSDLTPCLNGYWGDSCNTMVVGNPTDEQKRIFYLVKEALEIGINAIHPGVKACDVDYVMRKHLEKEGGFSHHGGHGVGTGYHEEPRIVPYNTMQLQQGMIIALEPAVYKNDFGIRLEHLMLVTDNGCEILTKFNHCFEQG